MDLEWSDEEVAACRAALRDNGPDLRALMSKAVWLAAARKTVMAPDLLEACLKEVALSVRGGAAEVAFVRLRDHISALGAWVATPGARDRAATGEQPRDVEARAVLAERRAERAERTLTRAGFEDHGGVDWAPPVRITTAEFAAMSNGEGADVQAPALRDDFAKVAMATLMTAHKDDLEMGYLGVNHIAVRAYKMADAMLRERGT